MKNPPRFSYEKFTPVTPKKESFKNINRSRSYKPFLENTLEKTRFEIWPLLCILKILISPNSQVKSN